MRHTSRHKRSNTSFPILIGIVLVLLAAWFFIDRSKRVEEVQPQPTGVTAPVETLYRNDAFHFSLKYDEKYFKKTETLGSFPWRENTTDPGELLVRITLQKSFEPHTNFSEGIITVGASGETNAVSNCLRAQNGETASGVTQIGNTTFFIFTRKDAGAGNFYTTTSYRVIQNEMCFALESTIHSTNIDNYDPSQGITEYNQDKVEKALTDVINTFRFE